MIVHHLFPKSKFFIVLGNSVLLSQNTMESYVTTEVKTDSIQTQ